MSVRSVKLVYCTGKPQQLLQAMDLLIALHLAFYYSKDFIRVKTRKDALVSTLRTEMKSIGMKVRTVVCD